MTGEDFFIVVLLVFAVYRVTNVLVEDSILSGPRFTVEGWLVRRGWNHATTLLHCPQCMGVWVSAAVVLVTTLTIGLALPLLVFGAVAGGASLLHRI